MISLYRGIVILCFVALSAAVMLQDMMPPELADRNQSSVNFPRMPPDFKEMARKLMMTCSKKGYRVPLIMDNSQNSSYTGRDMTENPISVFPELLSSLSPPFLPRSPLKPNETAEEQEPVWNIPEKIRNCTNLAHMIELMRNTTDGHLCFMRAFLAPLSWMAIMQNGTDLNKDNLMKLLWAAKPFLETMPPSNFLLPPILQISNLDAIMKMFGEVFNVLSEDQRKEIIGWLKERIAESEFKCLSKPSLSSLLPPKSLSFKPPVSSLPKCAPKMLWLQAKVLTMMGPFLSRLPLEEIKTIPKEELCTFFRSPDFSPSFRNIGGIQPVLGRALFQRLQQECSSGNNFTQQVDRLGSLACFFDDFQSLNATLSKKLLSQLDACDNSEIAKMKRLLVQKILEKDNTSLSREMLQSLGSAASVLTLSKLSSFTSEDLDKTLASLGQAKWNPAQARTLAKKLLDETKNISSEKLLSLGSVVRGVSSGLLRKMKTEGLLGNEALKNISEKMSPLQKKALLQAFRHDVNASELVKEIPDSLLHSLSLSTLEKANLTSVDQLEGHSWTLAQSAYLVKKILGKKINLGALRKLVQAVQGVTCEMIESVNRTNVLEMVQTLSESSDWLSRVQIRCAAQKLFASLEEQRPGYFNDISVSELQALPTILLIHLPMEKIQNLSDSVCSAFLEKMNQVNLSSLPNNAPSRASLARKAIRCLGENVFDLPAAGILSLGSLVCELDPVWITSLNAEALNATLQALASCQHIPQQHREQLFRLLTDTYGDPSNWSEEDMRTLGPLLLLNNTAVERLPFRSWLRSSLSDLRDSLSIQPMPVPKEFRFWFDLSALRRKLFELKTAGTLPSRKKRQVSASLTVVPTLSAPILSVIEDLGLDNVYWNPTQLYRMTVQSFKDALPILGEITNFSAEQLSAFRAKTLEAWGSMSMLNDSVLTELACISQSLSSEELCNVSISSLDTLDLLNTCNFTQTQRSAVWQAFQRGTRLNVTQLGELEMEGLGQFICGLQPAQIDQLNSTSLRESVEVVGRAPCPLNIIERLKDKAVAAFGKPETWSEAQADIMGNIIAGLSAVEIGHLNSTVMSFIRSSTIPLIPPDRLAALSVSQLKALGPDNAAMVTDSQRAALRADQRTAVEEAMGVTAPRAESTSVNPTIPLPLKGGAAVQSMAGYVVLVQLSMLMLFGYIG
ncbi:otoancorin isoform X2 [Triplophysa rosa]|uniref:Otoancorin n=2 Tax=Triplophysa rosa TaxID=992332 RepID=A0A9W8C2D5_TRIRA|nr:otoancorin isoform X2 [Triplophysa rosa]KAI7806231.1 putative otoancorin [Triplophysa rosa]